jgi:calcineurin-like phosphoesterase
MEALANPFESVEKILALEEGKYDLAVCDFHGEATSEKRGFGLYFDSRIHVMVGTHTHVPTADLSILPGGSGYITDLGMCGAVNSVLGMKTESAIRRMKTHLPTPYEISSHPVEAQGALFTIDPMARRVIHVETVRLREEAEETTDKK